VRKARCGRARITSSPALCPGVVQVAPRIGSDAFPAPELPGFDPFAWSANISGNMHPSDSLKVVCLPCLFSLSGILDLLMIGLHVQFKNLRVSRVALTTCWLTRMGERLRVSTGSLPITRPAVLPSGMHRPWAGSNRYKISELLNRSQPSGHTGSIHPRYLSVYASRYDFGNKFLIRTLQHSIPGVRLTLTQAGVTPASHQTISSTHVQHFVIPRGEPGVD
jgi:hypothetical protein